MKEYFLDLHIHLGSSRNGKAVKITASKSLTLENVLQECLYKKGIDLVGIVDCASTGVLDDLRELLCANELIPIAEGGFRYREKITLYTGVEVEAREDNGAKAHYLAYFPSLALLEEFAHKLSRIVKNPQLSTQDTHLPALALYNMVTDGGGIFIPAHIFTPHKGVFGSCATRLVEVFGPLWDRITAFEMGLSADSCMASYLPELSNKVLLSNSDAHSLEKIGREYNKVLLQNPTYTELEYLLKGEKGRRILANYGLDPKLGKYHRSYCTRCQQAFVLPEAVLFCPKCETDLYLVKGVMDRILSISPMNGNYASKLTRGSANPYYYNVPLSFLPGIGKKSYEKLITFFGSEMKILHEAKEDDLIKAAGAKTAALIIKAREGKLQFVPGAGGIYGRVDNEEK